MIKNCFTLFAYAGQMIKIHAMLSHKKYEEFSLASRFLIYLRYNFRQLLTIVHFDVSEIHKKLFF